MRIDNHRRVVAGLLMMLAGAIAAGCREATLRVPLHPTTGRILVDGKPAQGVEVRLHPAGELGSIDALTPFAATGEDGGFTLGTYAMEDGAPEGRYRVTLF